MLSKILSGRNSKRAPFVKYSLNKTLSWHLFYSAFEKKKKIVELWIVDCVVGMVKKQKKERSQRNL